MGLIDRLQSDSQRPPSASGPSLFVVEPRQQADVTAEDVGKERFQALKLRIQDQLLRKIDVTKLEEAGYAPLLSQVNEVIDNLVEENHLLLAEADRERLIEATTSDMLGLGPLEPLLQDNDISDILVNGYRGVWIERHGKIYKTTVRFRDDQHPLSGSYGRRSGGCTSRDRRSRAAE
jgi:pilus assembly protein CpaF